MCSIDKTNYKVALNLLQHSLRTIKDITRKNRKLIITPSSIWLIESGKIVMSGVDDITDYLHDTTEAYYDES